MALHVSSVKRLDTFGVRCHGCGMTDEETRAELEALVTRLGSVGAAARELGIVRGTLLAVLAGAATRASYALVREALAARGAA